MRIWLERNPNRSAALLKTSPKRRLPQKMRTARNSMAVTGVIRVLILIFSASLMGVTASWSQQSDDGQPAALAAPSGPGIAWQQLSPEQQKILEDVRKNWNRLPPRRQTALANGAQRFIRMNSQERDQAN